jgi:hypothetical protein
MLASSLETRWTDNGRLRQLTSQAMALFKVCEILLYTKFWPVQGRLERTRGNKEVICRLGNGDKKSSATGAIRKCSRLSRSGRSSNSHCLLFTRPTRTRNKNGNFCCPIRETPKNLRFAPFLVLVCLVLFSAPVKRDRLGTLGSRNDNRARTHRGTTSGDDAPHKVLSYYLVFEHCRTLS